MIAALAFCVLIFGGIYLATSDRRILVFQILCFLALLGGIAYGI